MNGKNILIIGLLLFILSGCRDSSSELNLPMAADSEITDTECEIPVEHHRKNPYTQQGSYSIGLCDGVLEVTLTLSLVGDPVSDETRDLYKYGIEHAWDTDRFEVPIRFNVIWDDADPDKTITVINGWGVHWNTSQWYERGRVETSVAHEAGHYIGLYDEYGGGDAIGYDGGAAPGPRPWHSPGIMDRDIFPTLDYYYDGLMLWYKVRK